MNVEEMVRELEKIPKKDRPKLGNLYMCKGSLMECISWQHFRGMKNEKKSKS